MNAPYAVSDLSNVLSPGLVFFKEQIRRNIALCVEIAGKAERLRPHVKTHKTREIVQLETEAGIRKQKCATVAEAEMLAACGVPDVLLAYPIVGPNCARIARLVKAFPSCRFSVLADHPGALKALSDTMTAAGQQVDVLIDLDVGQNRTGIGAGPAAVALYEQFDKLPSVRPGGFHVYDGHNHQEDVAERKRAVDALLDPVLTMRSTLEKKGLPVPRLVVGGTPTFPIYARMDLPGLECSPGTCILHDDGYGKHFPDMSQFKPAALVLTRVISRPTPRRVTFDLGYKAIASDPPAGKRLILLDVPDYQTVLQNEEHLVIETPSAERFQPGDTAFALPTHICPTCALHRRAYIVDHGKVSGEWEIVARDRMLSI